MIQWSFQKEKGLHIYVHVMVLFDSFQPKTFSVVMEKIFSSGGNLINEANYSMSVGSKF